MAAGILISATAGTRRCREPMASDDGILWALRADRQCERGGREFARFIFADDRSTRAEYTGCAVCARWHRRKQSWGIIPVTWLAALRPRTAGCRERRARANIGPERAGSATAGAVESTTNGEGGAQFDADGGKARPPGRRSRPEDSGGKFRDQVHAASNQERAEWRGRHGPGRE